MTGHVFGIRHVAGDFQANGWRTSRGPFIFYIAVERLDLNAERWSEYRRWLGRPDLRGLVTIDTLLCPPVVTCESGSGEAWDYVVAEEFHLDFFTDLPFLLRQAQSPSPFMILAALREPSSVEIEAFQDTAFVFEGFDLVDKHCSVSALLDCGGGFPDVFSVEELSQDNGLITNLERAFQIREGLARLYPNEFHADCHVWALWRYVGEDSANGDNSTSVTTSET